MAYSTTAELTAYATARGVTLTSDLDVLITKASDYIESLSYQGDRYVLEQVNAWPRMNVVIDNYLIPSDIVPQGIKNAEMQVAIEIESGNNPIGNVDRAVKQESLGDLSVTYMDSASDKTRLNTVNALIKPYLKGASIGSGHGLIRV